MHDLDAAPPRRRARLWPVAFMLMITVAPATGLLALYLAPTLAARWRQAENQAAADAAYLKRQAELKAESEAAGERLAALDQRVHLVSLAFREVARKVAPVVVNITNEKEVKQAAGNRTFYDFDTDRIYRQQAEGSGVLIKPGWVLTNNHVVRDAQRLRVTFASGRWLAVAPNVVATDPLTDLAVLRLPADPSEVYQPDYAAVAEWSDSDKEVCVGDWVAAFGSPFGLQQSVTAGIVSAKGRVELGILNQVELLQTDAPINPGNSGGPLCDQQGRVIGINVAIASLTGQFQGVGFAIPSNAAREVAEQLMEKGEVVRGYLGIGMQEVPPGLERRFGVGDTGGVFINYVGPHTPAQQTGLRIGDLVTHYNGETVGTANGLNQLRQRIARTPPDSTVPLEVLRGKERRTFQVTIAKRPQER